MSVFHQEDNVAVELTFGKLFGRLWPFLARHKSKMFFGMCLVLTYAAVGRALPFLFGHAIDAGIRLHNDHVIVQMAFAYLAVECLRAMMIFVQGTFIQFLGNQVLFEIREQLLRHIQNLPLTYFDKNPSGRIMTRATTDVFALGELFSQGFASIFICFVEMGTIFVSLAFLSMKLTWLIVLVLPALILVCRRVSRKIRVEFGAAKRALSTVIAFAAEAISGMKVLQLFHRQKNACKVYDHFSFEYRDHQLRTVGLFAMLWPTIEAFNLFSLCSSLLIGSYFADSVGLSAGQLSAFVLLLQSFFKPFKTILEKYNMLQNSLASADRVFQMFDETAETSSGGTFATDTRGLIEFKDVSFQYSEKTGRVLDGINVRIEPGTSVALVGRTGSGKTTMVGLLQRLYELKHGQILLDGQDIGKIRLSDLRSRIGIVQQDNFIFSGTFLTNITLEDPSVSRERALWAAEQAQCRELLERHGGLDAPVHERGANLSVGERQLIAFARALAFDPEILVLDEATANIDSVSEEKIQKALASVSKGRTSLIIAHRLSTVLCCDQILLLDKGMLLQNGSHQQLIERAGPYQDLCRSYFGKATVSV
jgi:ATP-binding cassette subfamily B protein